MYSHYKTKWGAAIVQHLNHKFVYKESQLYQRWYCFSSIGFYFIYSLMCFGEILLNMGESNVNIVVNNSFAPHPKIQRECKDPCTNANTGIRTFATTFNLVFQTGLCGPLTHWHRIFVLSFILAQHFIKCAWTGIQMQKTYLHGETFSFW